MDNRNARIAAVAAAVVAVLAVVALMVNTYRNTGAANAPPPEATSTPIDGTPAPAGPITPTGEASSPPEEGSDHQEAPYDPDAKTEAALVDVTVRFIAEWKRPGTPAQRAARLRPYATEWLSSQVSKVDPAELPTAAVDGQPAIVSATPYAASTTTPFDDGLRIRCNLVLDTTGWRVSEVLPEPTTASPTPTTPTPMSTDATSGQNQLTSPPATPNAPGTGDTPSPTGRPAVGAP